VNTSNRWNFSSGKILQTVITSALRDIYRVNLGVKKYERVLLFNDRIAENEDPSESDKERRSKLRCLALLAAEIGKKLCTSLHIVNIPLPAVTVQSPPKNSGGLHRDEAIKALQRERLLSLLLGKKARRVILQRLRLSSGDTARMRFIVLLHSQIIQQATHGSEISNENLWLQICKYALFDVSMLEAR